MGQSILITGHIVTSFHSNTATQKLIVGGGGCKRCVQEGGLGEAGKLRHKKGNFIVVCVGRRSVRGSNVVPVLSKADENLTRG